MFTLEEANSRYAEQMQNLESGITAVESHPAHSPNALEKTKKIRDDISEIWQSTDDDFKTQNGEEFCEKAIGRFANFVHVYAKKMILPNFDKACTQAEATLQAYANQQQKRPVVPPPAPEHNYDMPADEPAQNPDSAVTDTLVSPATRMVPESGLATPAEVTYPPVSVPPPVIVPAPPVSLTEKYFKKTEKAGIFRKKLSPDKISLLNKTIRLLLVFQVGEGDGIRQFAFGKKILFAESDEASNAFRPNAIYTTTVKCENMPLIYIRNASTREKQQLLSCFYGSDTGASEIIFRIYKDKSCKENEAFLSVQMKCGKTPYLFTLGTEKKKKICIRFNTDRRFNKETNTYTLSIKRKVTDDSGTPRTETVSFTLRLKFELL